MTEEQVELSRRAVACKGWRWMPGMVAHAPDSSVKARVQSVDDDVLEVWFPKGACGVSWPSWLVGRAIPDLTDPATLGCLVGLVRELYRAPWKLWDGHIEVRRDHQTLFFAVQFRHTPEGLLEEVHVGSGRTEVEAWVEALEASPGVTQ